MKAQQRKREKIQETEWWLFLVSAPVTVMVYYKKYCDNNTSGGVFYDEEKG